MVRTTTAGGKMNKNCVTRGQRHRVNLKTGVRPEEVTESNTAACGTLLLEFWVLSRLTGTP